MVKNKNSLLKNSFWASKSFLELMPGALFFSFLNYATKPIPIPINVKAPTNQKDIQVVGFFLIH
jgi:hypothetical protein